MKKAASWHPKCRLRLSLFERRAALNDALDSALAEVRLRSAPCQNQPFVDPDFTAHPLMLFSELEKGR
jgi:hypothetical protein